MPSIASRTQPLNEDKYARVDPPTAGSMPQPSIESAQGQQTPGMTAALRCTLPALYAATDNLRQFYRGGALPQNRVLPINPLR